MVMHIELVGHRQQYTIIMNFNNVFSNMAPSVMHLYLHSSQLITKIIVRDCETDFHIIYLLLFTAYHNLSDNLWCVLIM